jgi:RNA polymerase sigma-70 factor (ECF subfamily)
VDAEVMTDPAAADVLAERLRPGSKQAMAEVFSIHLDAIYKYCYRRSGSWSVAEGLTSSVFP